MSLNKSPNILKLEMNQIKIKKEILFMFVVIF